MSGLQHDWYVADADGGSSGPLSRVELAQAHARGAFPRDALAWHVEHAEWLPVARVVASMSALQAAAPAPREPASQRATSAPPRASRAGGDTPRAPRKPPPGTPQRPAPPPPAAVRPRVNPTASAREADQIRELRERLANSGMAAAASTASAAKSAETFLVSVRRALARALDVLGLGMLGAAIAWGVFEGEAQVPDGALLAWLAVLVLVPLEALALGFFGTTPGKAALGLRVVGADGRGIGLGTAFQRATTVVWRGVALGIPPLAVLAMIVAAVQTGNSGVAPWDRALGLRVEAAPIDNTRWQVAFGLLLLGLFLLAGGLWSELALSVADALRE